ncbi:MAG: enoyl-CoA hydratase/isomerase family protein, partial [Acidobacteriota bacterium]
MRIEYRDGFAILHMQMGKANAISPSFLAAALKALDELEEQSVNCIILTGYDKYFSAGLNLLELWEYNRIQLLEFVQQFEAVFVRILRLPQIVIAAINGHAIAGGAILAQLADYRIMVDGDLRIGVNEIDLGIPFPRQILEILKERLPRASYFDVLYRGLLFPPQEALRVGLIDEISAPESLEQRAILLATELAAKSKTALACIKH